jgi:thymidine kinase
MTKLYFYYSSMNAGKTTSLIQSNYNYIERGFNTLVYITDPLNNDLTKVTSRTGLSISAINLKSSYNVYEDVFNKNKIKKIDCVFVDESQFLTKEQVLQICKIVDVLNIPVLCYGLRTDSMGDPFEGSIWILAYADKLCELKSICFCGSKATMNHRLHESSEKIILDQGMYEALCRKHFLNSE